MKRNRQWQQGRPAIELIEEVFHLLRRAPVATLFCYYAGSVPLVLGVLFFLADMSRGVLASDRVAAAAFGVTLLFLWMKCWQTVFAQRLLAHLCGEEAPRWTIGRFLRAGMVQTILQPWGMFLLPVAAVVLVPFAWVYGFFQSVTVLGSGETTDVRAIARQAWQQARLWTGQSNAGLAAFKVFGMFVAFNLVTAILAVPYLLKVFLGIETTVSRMMETVDLFLRLIFNSTFITAILGLTYLCVDPLLKTFFVLRCFYGESLRTGQDLKTELRGLAAPARLAALLLLGGVLLGAWPAAGGAAENAATPSARPAAGNQVSPTELDRSIERVIRQREYTWRLPPDKVDAAKEAGSSGFFRMLERFGEAISKGGRSVGKWIEEVLDKLSPRPRTPNMPNVPFSAWMTRLYYFLLFLLGVLVLVLAYLVFRAWKRRRQVPEVAAQAAPPMPDLNDENVGADQLPEDGWISLARELIERGELRLALRAWYLASLAFLAERDLIALAKFKSNREYERELGRRGHALPETLTAFSENVAAFDRVWYGLHEVNRELLDSFARNVERIKTTG